MEKDLSPTVGEGRRKSFLKNVLWNKGSMAILFMGLVNIHIVRSQFLRLLTIVHSWACPVKVIYLLRRHKGSVRRQCLWASWACTLKMNIYTCADYMLILGVCP